jgi:hypothetical protein
MSKWLRLLINPFCVNEVAKEASLLTSMLLGACAYTTLLWTFFMAMMWGIGEPYPTFEDYLRSIPSHVAIIFWVVLAVMIIVAFTGATLMLPKTLRTPEARASLLCPVPWVIPGLLLGAMAVIGGATHPNMGILGGVPGWARWPPFGWASGCATPILMLALVYATWAYAMAQLGRDARTMCVECGYPRTGLIAATSCPECGAAMRHDRESEAESTSSR